MHLFIQGVEKKQFEADKILFEKGQVLIASDGLALYINDMQGELTKLKTVLNNMTDAPASPAAPTAPVFEIVEAENLPYTIDQYKASGWDEAQLLAAGHLIKREVSQVGAAAPSAPGIPAAPGAPSPDSAGIPDVPELPKKAAIEGQFEVEDQLYMMTERAAGASYEQFQGSGWKIEALVSEGYAKMIGGEAPKAEEEKTYPFINSEGDWEDKAGTIWDAAKHSMGSNKVPPVTNKGLFKKTRAKAKAADVIPSAPPAEEQGIPAAPGEATNAIPSAPAAKSASGVPSAPGAATIDVVPESSTITDEPLDEELSNIVKNWG